MKKIALWVIYFPAKKGGMRLGGIQTDPFLRSTTDHGLLVLAQIIRYRKEHTGDIK